MATSTRVARGSGRSGTTVRAPLPVGYLPRTDRGDGQTQKIEFSADRKGLKPYHHKLNARLQGCH